jgi:mono/diheme cytochrome c family protein
LRALAMALLTMVLLAMAATLGAQPPGSNSKSGEAAAGDAQNGKKIFTSDGCYQCHGYDGHGGAGARLAPNPIAFTAFSRYVRQPTGEMPPYTTKVVSDKELADIYAFLQTIPAPPPVKNIPLLNK